MYEVSIIAARERRSISDLIVSLLEKYYEEHKEGNSTYQLNKWIENSDFLATPAFFETRDKWTKHIYSIDNSKEIDKYLYKVKTLEDVLEKRKHEFKWKEEWKTNLSENDMDEVIDENRKGKL